MSSYPTPWQEKTMWAALTALFVVFLIVIAGAVVWVGANFISFLQPILIPVAIAAILAYLLDPLVTRLCRRGMQRTPAIAIIFLAAFLALGSLVWWLVPTISMQSANFAKELPAYTQTARDRVVDLIVRYNHQHRKFFPRIESIATPAINHHARSICPANRDNRSCACQNYFS
jgi:predicted PurR-regulated permease PerM